MEEKIIMNTDYVEQINVIGEAIKKDREHVNVAVSLAIDHFSDAYKEEFKCNVINDVFEHYDLPLVYKGDQDENTKVYCWFDYYNTVFFEANADLEDEEYEKYSTIANNMSDDLDNIMQEYFCPNGGYEHLISGGIDDDLAANVINYLVMFDYIKESDDSEWFNTIDDWNLNDYTTNYETIKEILDSIEYEYENYINELEADEAV